jgi:transcription elongation GreA/GreB family factor
MRCYGFARMTDELPNKHAVRDALRRALESALETMARAAQQTREGATHEESRAEGDKDMRSTEQSYLARGQAMRAEELAEQLARLDLFTLPTLGPDDPIVPGALVRVSIDDVPRVFFVIAQGGGTELVVDGARITVVTPASPVGAALMGRRADDEFELSMRGALRECVIEAVR